MLTPNFVCRVAENEITISNLTNVPFADYSISVKSGYREHPRLLPIFWDVNEPNEDGKYQVRQTVVDKSQSEAMVRYRVRAMFAYPPEFVSLFQETDLSVCDHPDEKPPEN